jgi:hypothetical protein
MIIQVLVRLTNAFHSHAVFSPSDAVLSPSAPFQGNSNKMCGKISIRDFLTDQRGLNTVELVVIIAIVIGLALLFRGRITTFVSVLLDGLFSDETAKTLVDGVKVVK